MIIWINGAFGSGKTQTAYELHRRIPDSFLYDPEKVGFFLRKNIPFETLKEDFQDYSSWRECNYSILKYIDKEYNGVIIVPMTVVNAQYFKEIVGELSNDGIIVKHFVLWASKKTIERRLRSRGERKNSWGAQQIDRCMEGLSNPIFKKRINTEKMTIETVAETIAAIVQIPLHPDGRSKIRKKLSRITTQIKQLRFLV